MSMLVVCVESSRVESGVCFPLFSSPASAAVCLPFIGLYDAYCLSVASFLVLSLVSRGLVWSAFHFPLSVYFGFACQRSLELGERIRGYHTTACFCFFFLSFFLVSSLHYI